MLKIKRGPLPALSVLGAALLLSACGPDPKDTLNEETFSALAQQHLTDGSKGFFGSQGRNKCIELQLMDMMDIFSGPFVPEPVEYIGGGFKGYQNISFDNLSKNKQRFVDAGLLSFTDAPKGEFKSHDGTVYPTFVRTYTLTDLGKQYVQDDFGRICVGELTFVKLNSIGEIEEHKEHKAYSVDFSYTYKYVNVPDFVLDLNLTRDPDKEQVEKDTAFFYEEGPESGKWTLLRPDSKERRKFDSKD